MFVSNRRFFNDVTVISNRGEYRNNPAEVKLDPVGRLIRHVIDIMCQARNAHQSLSAADAARTVTRFIFNEFSLYTNRTPLTLDEFKCVVGCIREVAATIPKGVHLVIGTIPVLWPDDTLHNAGLYVQCGATPLIHFIEKNCPHVNDPNYVKDGKKLRFFGQTFVEAPQDESVYSSDRVLADTGIAVNDINQYRNAIKINIDGVEAIVINEICYEHALAMGVFFLDSLINQLKLAGQSVPGYASQLILSDSVLVVEKHRIANVTQADPNHIKPAGDYRKTVALNNPLFGNKTTLYYLPEVELGQLDRDKLDGKDVYAVYGNSALPRRPIGKSSPGASFFDILCEALLSDEPLPGFDFEPRITIITDNTRLDRERDRDSADMIKSKMRK